MGELNYIRLSEDTYILQTYKGQYDGLSYVSSRLAEGCSYGQEKPAPGARKKVLVPGIPHMYVDRLDANDINICYTTFETDHLPQSWTEPLNRHYQGCIVPHPAVKKVFAGSGVTIPIFVAHQGYTRLPQSSAGHRSLERTFTIGFLGVPQARKNLHKLFDACRSLVREALIPELKLAVHAATYYDELDPARFDTMKKADFVLYSEGKKTEQELAAWYANLSAYCFPSSGEGWSFTPRESLYLGVPTILSDIPVHRELIRSGYCQPVPHRGREPALYDHYENGKRGKAAYGKWHSIETADIRQSILDVYRHYPAFLAKAAEGSRWIARKWKNEDSLRRVGAIMTGINLSSLG
uniref:Glycosyl transferases group 1 n=1 Tax=Candidatus Kentrum sp. DK TaxID=2126562 RepID=A0A450SWY2_9GAMM|nr:MAG: Glycosyl transferases group 1 [Candidatus Kentron sp. DK]